MLYMIWLAGVVGTHEYESPVIIAEKMKAEYERDLLDHILSSVDVGKKTTFYNGECWSYVAWAVKALQLATSADIAQSTSMIWQVHSKLPSTKAVTEPKGSRLTEKQEQHLNQTQELKALHTDLARVQL